jgi:hypothetical protein
MRKAEETKGGADVQGRFILLLVVGCDSKSHYHDA